MLFGGAMAGMVSKSQARPGAEGSAGTPDTGLCTFDFDHLVAGVTVTIIVKTVYSSEIQLQSG
jgi:hypothetical protein